MSPVRASARAAARGVGRPPPLAARRWARRATRSACSRSISVVTVPDSVQFELRLLAAGGHRWDRLPCRPVGGHSAGSASSCSSPASRSWAADVAGGAVVAGAALVVVVAGLTVVAVGFAVVAVVGLVVDATVGSGAAAGAVVGVGAAVPTTGTTGAGTATGDRRVPRATRRRSPSGRPRSSCRPSGRRPPWSPAPRAPAGTIFAAPPSPDRPSRLPPPMAAKHTVPMPSVAATAPAVASASRRSIPHPRSLRCCVRKGDRS